MNLSVIVANYNNGPYIRECLESILTQTYKDVEIIVSDDGSTDESPHIIKEYEKKYPGIVKGIFCPLNRGVARTRHEAILQARGEYMTTLDSDDYYNDSHKLEKEMELIRFYKEKHGKDILAFSNVLLVKEDKKTIGTMGDFGTIKEGMILDDIISRSCMIPTNFIMVRSTYFEVGGYDFSLKTHEDWDLKIRLAQKYEFWYTHAIGFAYRRHFKGLSSCGYFITTKNLWKVFYRHWKSIPGNSRRRIKDSFFRFMKERNKRLIRRYVNQLNANLNSGVFKQKLRLLYYLLMDSIIKTKWKIKIKWA